MPPTDADTTSFIALANVIVKAQAPREYHFSHEWEYTIEMDTKTPTHLEVWRRNDPNRRRRPYKIALPPQVSQMVKHTLAPFHTETTN